MKQLSLRLDQIEIKERMKQTELGYEFQSCGPRKTGNSQLFIVLGHGILSHCVYWWSVQNLGQASCSLCFIFLTTMQVVLECIHTSLIKLLCSVYSWLYLMLVDLLQWWLAQKTAVVWWWISCPRENFTAKHLLLLMLQDRPWNSLTHNQERTLCQMVISVLLYICLLWWQWRLIAAVVDEWARHS